MSNSCFHLHLKILSMLGFFKYSLAIYVLFLYLIFAYVSIKQLFLFIYMNSLYIKCIKI